MHASGIAVNQELRAAFSAANDDGTGYISISLENDTFTKIGAAASTGTLEGDFEAVKATLIPKTPVYNLLRVPHASASEKDKWLVVFYCPDRSPVRSKMLYASSQGALKSGLGGSKFLKWDFPIDSPEECSLAEYRNATKDYSDKELLTFEELTAKNAHADQSSTMSEVSVAAIVGVPINVSDEAVEAIKAVGSGAHNTVVFWLNKAEVLECSQPSTQTLDDVSANELPDNEPRFVLHAFAHEHEGESVTRNMFIYYCPGKAKPKLRMFYSTVKANVITVIEKLGLDKSKNVECSEANEVSVALALEELYPKVVKKKLFKKPKARGGRAKLKKFQA